jgi:hypothetical protein
MSIVTEKKKSDRYMSIRFMDGDNLKIRFPALMEEGDMTLGQAIKEITEWDNLVFTLEGKLLLIPLANVRAIEIYPAPKNLPKQVIQAEFYE